MSDRELRRLEVLQDLDRRRLTPAAARQLLGSSGVNAVLRRPGPCWGLP